MTGSVKFVNQYTKDKNGRPYTKVNAANFIQILEGKQMWECMPSSQKNIIHGLLLTQNSKSFDELIKAADQIKEAAQGFLQRWLFENDTPQYTLTVGNYEGILQGVQEWDELSTEERKAIHALLTYHQGESYPILYERAMHVKKETESFINSYLMDQDGSLCTQVDKDHYKKILEGEAVWQKKSPLIKAAIDQRMNQPHYLELLNGALMLLDTCKRFIEDYLSSVESDLYEEVNEENMHQILQGAEVWKRMTENQKMIINETLMLHDRKLFEDMLDDARTIQYERKLERSR